MTDKKEITGWVAWHEEHGVSAIELPVTPDQAEERLCLWHEYYDDGGGGFEAEYLAFDEAKDAGWRIRPVKLVFTDEMDSIVIKKLTNIRYGYLLTTAGGDAVCFGVEAVVDLIRELLSEEKSKVVSTGEYKFSLGGADDKAEEVDGFVVVEQVEKEQKCADEEPKCEE